MILCGAGGTVSSLVGNSMILTTVCSAVRQQTISVMPEVYVSRLCERLCGVRRRTAAPETQLWRIWGAGVILGSRRLIHIPTLLVWPAQFGVAKSPNHPAEIDEKRAHDQNHERVGLHHGFVDWRCHRLWWMMIGSELPKCAHAGAETVRASGIIHVGWTRRDRDNQTFDQPIDLAVTSQTYTKSALWRLWEEAQGFINPLSKQSNGKKKNNC